MFRNKNLDQLINKHNDAEDLKQDVFIVLLNKPPALIVGLNERGELLYYAIKIVKNLAKESVRDRAKRRVIPEFPTAEHCVLIEQKEQQVIENKLLEKYISAFESLPSSENGMPYFKELIKIIIRHGSMNKAAEATGIPLTSIHRDVLFIREFIKSKVC